MFFGFGVGSFLLRHRTLGGEPSGMMPTIILPSLTSELNGLFRKGEDVLPPLTDTEWIRERSTISACRGRRASRVTQWAWLLILPRVML